MTKNEVLERIENEHRYFNRPAHIDDSPWDRGYNEGYANALKNTYELVNRIEDNCCGKKIFVISLISKDFGDFNTVRTYLFSAQETAEKEFKRLFEMYGVNSQLEKDNENMMYFDDVIDSGYFYGKDNDTGNEFVVTIKSDKVMR